MSQRDEGVVKYRCTWNKGPAPSLGEIEELDRVRTRCFDASLVGVYPDGIGYGNLSCRIGTTRTFWITGSATGALPRLSPEHYTQVVTTTPERNEVVCEGPIQASSESMTHAVIYDHLPEINAVIHVHSRALWEALIHRVPTTPAEVPYGTPEMCVAVRDLLSGNRLDWIKLFVMGGHPEGLVAFGRDLRDAEDVLFNAVRHPDGCVPIPR